MGLLVWVVHLRLRVLLMLVLVLMGLGVGDAEPVAAAVKGWVFAMPGTKTATSVVGRVVVHVYPADKVVAGGSTVDPSRSAGGRESLVAALARPSRGSRGAEVVVGLVMFRYFNRRVGSGFGVGGTRIATAGAGGQEPRDGTSAKSSVNFNKGEARLPAVRGVGASS